MSDVLDELRRLVEEGVDVGFVYVRETKQFRAILTGPKIGDLLDPRREYETELQQATGLCNDFGSTILEAVAVFRKLWINQRPRNSTRFRCVGGCWTLDCDCRKHEGEWNPKVLPPLHDGCTCIVEHPRRPTL
jgi:hypothetical protein